MYEQEQFQCFCQSGCGKAYRGTATPSTLMQRVRILLLVARLLPRAGSPRRRARAFTAPPSRRAPRCTGAYPKHNAVLTADDTCSRERARVYEELLL
eukprot:203976-Pleurochrysis_carterae.AAC.1